MNRPLLLFLSLGGLLQMIFFTGPAITGGSPLFFVLLTVVNVALLPLYLKLEASWERRSQAKRRGRSTVDR